MLALLAAVVAAALVYRGAPARTFSAAALVQTLPPDQAIHAYLDVALLRSSGYLDLLSGSPAIQEPDYKKFVEESGFDYRKDLDAAALAFRNGSVYMTLHGRFTWPLLQKYAESHDGHCSNGLCSLPATTPARTISFYQIQPGILALASAPDQRAAAMIGPLQWPTPPSIPTAALWVSTPPFVFDELKSVPTGSRSFLSPLSQSTATIFTLGQGSASGLELRMHVESPTPAAASALAKQLSSTTDLLTRMLKRDKMTPTAGDLSSVLIAGRFESKEKEVSGIWPITRPFLESLISARLP